MTDSDRRPEARPDTILNPEPPADVPADVPADMLAAAASPLARIRLDPSLSRSIAGVHVEPEREGSYGPWPSGLDSSIVEAARRRGIGALFGHQSAAVEASLSGECVVVATGPASGKSLCYVLPTLQALATDPRSTALYLFPTKALARDQLSDLIDWGRELPELGLAPAAYDGDASPADRRRARDGARIVVANPDIVHGGLLPYHPRWERFLSGLDLIVIDEMHVYRGLFGSHVANVLRRLRRVARHYGADPRVVFTSATLANPGELARSLWGEEAVLVDQDQSPRGQRTFLFYNPPVIDEDLNLHRSVVLESERIARRLLEGDVATIVFARTRQSTELLVRYVSGGLAAAGRPDIEVRGYRGGYTPSERREIEAALRDGRVRCVVATNALELGIDIGHLDACVMAGYPGSIAATLQQAGRAGRRDRPGLAVLVADASPLDQFIVREPAYFLGRRPERALIDPDNLLVLLAHLRCAAFELPFSDAEADEPFGGAAVLQARPSTAGHLPASAADQAPATVELLRVLEAQGDVVAVGGHWHWMSGAYPAESVGLRSTVGDEVRIVDVDRDDVLGTVPLATAGVTVHPGAVYLHDGATFQVEALDLDDLVATVRPTGGAVYTRASTSTRTRPESVDATRAATGAEVSCGELEIRVKPTAYRRIRFKTHETVGWGTIDLPEHVQIAGAYWFALDPGATESLESAALLRVDDGDRGPNWSAQRDAVRARDEYRCRRCQAPERPGRTHDVHHLEPYRTFRLGPGVYDWERANALANLVTLCRPCHRSTEREVGTGSALGGVAYALLHVASVHLMCDPRDLGMSAEARAPWSKAPTIAIYERAGGAGYGRALFGLHEELLDGVRSLVASCPCKEGCPSCVGVSDFEATGGKDGALTVLALLGA